MALALDAVKALCLESPAGGGTQIDYNPTEVDPTQDALTAAGLFVNGPSVSSPDKQVLVDRTGTSLRFTDAAVTRLLSELVSATTGQTTSHDSLRDIQHFLAGEGPGTGFASGAVQTTTFISGTPLVGNQTWWTSSAQTQKIVSKTLAYVSGTPLVSSVTWMIYGPTGSVLRTLVDTATYTGPLLTSVVRTWS